MIQKVNYQDYLEITYQRLARGGVFLTVDGPKPNTMTIGWGGVNIYWGKPVFIVPVRESRHTFSMIEKASDFTVSVPIEVDMKKQLAFCGTRSGRDIDKYSAVELKLQPAQLVKAPIIADCELHYECKIIYKHALSETNLDPAIVKTHYPDYHTLYFGEILTTYLIPKGR
ncbi:MAG: flavin reductase family protein [Firmicutes bacterium]|nr:flavin reductase family protein [Bacillota bacterium]